MPKVRTKTKSTSKKEEKIVVTGQNSDCKLCPLHKTSAADGTPSVCLWGSGNKNADLLFVAESPGREELLSSNALTGESGRIFDKYLGFAKLDRNEVYVTNSVKCRSVTGKAPKPKELKTCKSYLDFEIKLVKPKVIVTLGAVALKATLGIEGIAKYRGRPFYSKEYGCYCVPTFHPSYLVRNADAPELSEKFLRDIEYAKKIAETGDTGQLGTTVHVVDTKEKFNDFKDKLLKASVTSVDTETVGNYLSGKILTVQFSWKAGEAYVLPIHKTPSIEHFWDKDFEKEVWSFLKTYLEDAKHRKVGQNIKYDYQFFKLYGITLKGVVFDTMLAHYLLDENAVGRHSLDSLSLNYTDMGNYSVELHKALGVKKPKDIGPDTYAGAPFEDLCTYGGKDVDCTFRVFCVFYKRIKEQNLSTLLNKVMIPLSFILGDMELRGVKADVDYFKKLATNYEKQLVEIEKELRSFPDVKLLERQQGKPVNFGSSDQLRVLFYNILKLPVYKMTSTKNRKTTGDAKPSTDKSVLERLQEEHPIPEIILKHRKVSKFLSTYVSPVPGLVMEDGRLHTSYRQHITTTGRLSSSNPNLQNIPKRDPVLAKQIRDGFIAEDGYTFIEADYGQLEFRLLASVSGDPTMIADISDADVDIHKKIASVAFGMPYDQVDKKTRETAKTIVYSVVYGKSESNLAKETELSVEQVKNVFSALFKRYPKMKSWMETTAKNAEAGYPVVNWIGRRRRLAKSYAKARAMKNFKAREMLKAEARRQAINSPIQGGGHDILSVATIRVYHRIAELKLKSRLVMNIHDAIIVETHNSEIDVVGRIIKEEMERPIKTIKVPMIADMEIGIRLGEMKHYEPSSV